MNTNNALERITLVKRATKSVNGLHTFTVFLDNQTVGEIKLTLPELDRWNTEMQPQVSESDEAVAREIASVYRTLLRMDKTEAQCDAEATAIIAKHRQSAVVSADAVEVARLVKRLTKPHEYGDGVEFIDEAAAAAIIQAYGDQRELNGARKMQYSGDKVADQVWNRHRSSTARKAINDYRVSLRALSHETVCGGE